MPWSPLARGILAGSVQGGFEARLDEPLAGRGPACARRASIAATRDFEIADRVVEIAEKYGKAPAQIALAWLLAQARRHAPVVGVSKLEQLDQLVAATELALDAQDLAYLEELYRPLENLLSHGMS